MTNEIGDIVRRIDRDSAYLVVDLQVVQQGVYIYHLYELGTGKSATWCEPFNRQLSTAYWHTLA